MIRLLPLLFAALAWVGCEANGPPAGDIVPEPAAQAAEAPTPAAPTPADDAPTGDTPTADVANPANPGSGSGSCCGSPSCGQAKAGGCGCRRNLPQELAAQVNCGG